MSFKYSIIIPTYNGEKSGIEDLLKSIQYQTIKPLNIFIMDSSSTDNTVEICSKYNCNIEVIKKSDFNHGETRMKGINKCINEDYAVILTQDVLLHDNNTIEILLNYFDNPNVSIVYGKQNPRITSSYSEKISRKFNYPDESRIKSMKDIEELGISTPFCSDSFSAYRIEDLKNIGGFPKTSFGEDMLTAAKLILQGKSIAYAADAKCIHSHKYSLTAEYNRGKAIGKMHKENSWLIENFGKAENRGNKLLKFIPFSKKIIFGLQVLPKYIGYKVGKYL